MLEADPIVSQRGIERGYLDAVIHARTPCGLIQGLHGTYMAIVREIVDIAQQDADDESLEFMHRDACRNILERWNRDEPLLNKLGELIDGPQFQESGFSTIHRI